MIDVAVEAADRFYPAFDFLVEGAKSPGRSHRRLHVRDRGGQA